MFGQSAPVLLGIVLCMGLAFDYEGATAETMVEQQVEQLLREHYKIFEMSGQHRTEALELAAAGLTDDFSAIFYTPSQTTELLDKKGWLEGVAQGFTGFQGKQPVMEVKNVTVLARSESEAVAAYKLELYLGGVFQSDALVIADLRQEDGSWRIYRVYESVRLPGGQPTVVQQVEQFLREHYKKFEMSQRDRAAALGLAAAGMTDDYTAIFYIPSQKKELLHFDKKSILEGLAQAFTLYQGKHPVMKIKNLTVLSRSENAAVAAYQMDFYLDRVFRNDALVIADLRREDSSWRICRLYENKRR